MKKIRKPNRDELTEKMHSEFRISKEKEVEFKCYLALERIHKYKYTMNQVLELFDVTEEQIKKHEPEFLKLYKND